MPKFKVTIEQTEIYEIEVDSKDIDKAVDKAWNILEKSAEKEKYHIDSKSDDFAVEINKQP
jgi:ribosome-associated translation inhibitor RaiA